MKKIRAGGTATASPGRHGPALMKNGSDEKLRHYLYAIRRTALFKQLFLFGGRLAPRRIGAWAAELGYAALAITDRNSLAGIVRAHTAAKDLSLKLIVGSEIRPVDAPPIVLWAKDRKAYGNLCRLITSGRLRAAKGQCNLGIEDLSSHSAGLLAGVVPPPRCEELSAADLAQYRELFGKSCYLLAELHQGPHDRHGSIGSKTYPAKAICR